MEITIVIKGQLDLEFMQMETRSVIPETKNIADILTKQFPSLVIETISIKGEQGEEIVE